MRTRIIVSCLAAGFVLAVASPLSAESRAGTDGASTSTFDALLDAELGRGGGLTAEEVARRATATSPAVRERNEDLNAAEAEVRRAVYAYIPTTTVSARYARLSNTQGTLPADIPVSFEQPRDQYVLEAGISVPVSDYLLRVGPGRDAADYGKQAAANNLAATRNQAASEARLAYYDWVEAKLRVLVAEQALAQASAHLADAKAGFAAGSTSNADVMRVESRVASSELLLTASRHLSELREEQLRTAMHEREGVAFRIGEDVRKPLEARSNEPLRVLWAEALANRQELKALAAARAVQEKSATVERAGYAPRLDLFANAQYARPNARVFPIEDEFRGSWDAGARISWTFSDVPAAGARASSAEARARAVAEQRNALVDRIRVEVMSARQAVDRARIAEGTTARGLAAAEESYRARRLLFQNGRATTVELLDAETDLTSARLEALDARIDARVAEVRLAQAIGRELPGPRRGKSP